MAFLTYGSQRLTFDLPGDGRVLVPEWGRREETEAQIIRRSLSNPIGTPPLAEVARGRRRASVLIACRTRRTGSHVFLPEIVRTLNAAGIPDERILVTAATGTHDNWRPRDAELLAGADCARRLRFVAHDCRGNLVDVGTTSRGNRVRLNRDYLDSDLKIATGRVTHHYFAGFTGGRKAILPGVSDFDSIVFNHRMAVLTDPEVGLEPSARNGSLASNPVHLDMLEAAYLAPPDFTLCTVLDAENRIVHAFGGDMESSHRAATDLVREGDSPEVEELADWSFLSCGGANGDVNAVQSIKSLVNNYGVTRPGGAIILSAECAEGMASWLRELCAAEPAGDLERRVVRGELRHPHNALWIRRVRERAHVIMITKLAEDDVRGMGFHKAESLSQAMALATERVGRPDRTFAIPYGNVTVVRPARPGGAVRSVERT